LQNNIKNLISEKNRLKKKLPVPEFSKINQRTSTVRPVQIKTVQDVLIENLPFFA
jgi:hypothetical protein